MVRNRNAWSYVDARDLGQIVHRCLQTDGLGFQVFNAVNDTITANEPTSSFLRRFCPQTPHTRPLVDQEAPISNRKIREVLGFKEAHNWRRELEKLRAIYGRMPLGKMVSCSAAGIVGYFRRERGPSKSALQSISEPTRWA